MSDIEEEKYEYFYVAFHALGFAGSCVIRQNKLPGFNSNPNGMNIVDAHIHITSQIQTPAVVTNWKKITLRRYTEFNAFLEKIHSIDPEPEKRKSNILRLVPPSKEDHEPPNAS